MYIAVMTVVVLASTGVAGTLMTQILAEPAGKNSAASSARRSS